MATKRTTATAPVPPSPPPSQDLVHVTPTAGVLVQWFENMTAFFTTASAMEAQAKATLDQAKAWKAPTTGHEDELLKDKIRDVRRESKALEDFWGITSVVSQFHKRLVAGRQRGVAMLEEAHQIGTRLHTTFTEAERRRAAAEQERVRVEAEKRARDERAAELAKLEAQALEREAASADLSEREKIYVNLFVNGFAGERGNPVVCARQAGYQNPEQIVTRLTSSAKVQDAIRATEEAAAIRTQVKAVTELPLDVQVEEVVPDLNEKGNRATWSAEVVDEAAFIEAVLSRRHGIPSDVLQVNQVVLNQYARSLHELLNKWPGVHAKKKESVV